MKLGVISDTHLKAYDKKLEAVVEKYFSDADIILHAGDIVDLGVLGVFGGKTLYAVCGNMDLASIRNSFPYKQVLEIKGHSIGLIHGWGTPHNIEEKLIREFDTIDCLVYGHTHMAVNHKKDNVLFFNPGSPTDRMFASNNTVGIIEIGDTITGKIIEVTD